MKKVFLSITLILLLSTSICFASTTNIIINNQQVNFTEETGQPFIANDHTLVPMRVVMEQYGCTVTWSQSLQTVTITKGDAEVKVPIGQEYILVNNQAKPIEAPGQVINGKTYLPIRAVLEGVGAKVEWDNNSKSVVVNSDKIKNNVSNLSINKEEESQQLAYEEFLKMFDVSKLQYKEDEMNRTILIYKQDIKRDDLRDMLKKMNNLEQFAQMLIKQYYDPNYPVNDVVFRTNKSEFHVALQVTAIDNTDKLSSLKWIYKPETTD